MSRRTRRRAKDAGREAGARPEGPPQRPRGARPGREGPTGDAAPERPPAGRGTSLGAQLVLLAAVFALAVLVAELVGAASLGVAFGVGQIAFAIALVYLLIRR
jgi:hypothetical protein